MMWLFPKSQLGWFSNQLLLLLNHTIVYDILMTQEWEKKNDVSINAAECFGKTLKKWVGVRHHKFVQTHKMDTTKSEPSCELWAWSDSGVSVWFVHCNKCPTVAGDVRNGEGYACVSMRGAWEISVPLVNAAMSLKLLQKVKAEREIKDHEWSKAPRWPYSMSQK